MSPPQRRNEIGLARQLWLLLVLPIAFALGVYGVFAHVNRQRLLMAEASAETRNYATLVEAALGGTIVHEQLGSLRQKLDGLARADRIVGIAAFEESGGAVFATAEVEAFQAQLSEIAARALSGRHEVEEERSLGSGRTLVRTVTLTTAPTGSRLVVVIVRDLQYVTVLANFLDRGLALTGAIVILVIALVAGWVTRQTVGEPVVGIVRGAERVAGGDLSGTVHETGAREMRQLARAFNGMTHALAEARGRLELETEQRAAIERRVTHLQALAAAGQVAASVGHEIGSPLNVILGRARRAANHPTCSEPLRKELDTIAHQSERISRVVAGLLALARPAASASASANARAVAEEVLAFLAPECRRRGVLTLLDAAESRTWVALDADPLFQVLFNLCLNALQSQPTGGEIAIRVGPGPATASGEPQVEIEVADRGAGIAVPDLERIFEPFFTTKGESGGSGLGLAIVSGVVREAGGKVEVESAPSAGAKFRVLLPAAARPVELVRETA